MPYPYKKDTPCQKTVKRVYCSGGMFPGNRSWFLFVTPSKENNLVYKSELARKTSPSASISTDVTKECDGDVFTVH